MMPLWNRGKSNFLSACKGKTCVYLDRTKCTFLTNLISGQWSWAHLLDQSTWPYWWFPVSSSFSWNGGCREKIWIMFWLVGTKINSPSQCTLKNQMCMVTDQRPGYASFSYQSLIACSTLMDCDCSAFVSLGIASDCLPCTGSRRVWPPPMLTTVYVTPRYVLALWMGSYSHCVMYIIGINQPFGLMAWRVKAWRVNLWMLSLLICYIITDDASNENHWHT